MRIWTRSLSALVLATSLLLTGCGGDGKDKDKKTDKTATGKSDTDKKKGDDPKADPDKDKKKDKDDTEKKTDPEPKPDPEPDKGGPTIPDPDPMPEPKPDPEPEPEPKPKPEPDPEPMPPGPDTDDDETASTEAKTSGDWKMWGGTINRNMVNATTGITTEFNAEYSKFNRELKKEEVFPARRQLWEKPAGSQAYANPVVSDGRVFVGANNGSGYREEKYPAETDLGVVLCFDEKTGDFVWQLSREKLAAGRVNDWNEQGICSTPFVEGEKLYVVTNRAELMCLDVKGFANGNQGFEEETLTEEHDADILWSLDMIEDLGVFPHNLATSCPVVYGDNVYLITSNGVGEEHLEVPAPRAPCFIAVNKETGELLWEDNTPFDGILHGQWSSPAVAEVDGKGQILVAGGDGWLFSFDPAGDGDGGGKLNWKFDLNPKDSTWLLGGEGTRNAIISTPVVVGSSVILAVGQDPEHGNGVGHLYRIDVTKEGDVSPQIVVDGDGNVVDAHEDGQLYDETKHQLKPNPNSAQVWYFGGVDTDGSITGKKDSMVFRRTISTAAVADGLVFVPDLMGYLHCLDFETGERYWEFDTFGEIWGSPMVADGKVFLGDAEGDLTIFAADKGAEGKPNVLATLPFPNAIYCTPTIANGNMYLTDRNTLYAFKITGEAPVAAGDGGAADTAAGD